jgi:hypothetical protein
LSIGLASLHTSLTVEYDGPAAKLGAIIVDELEFEARRRATAR